MSALTISPEDEKRVKGMGFLNNRGTDLFSARVLTTNGKVTAAQHRCMAVQQKNLETVSFCIPPDFPWKSREFPTIRLKNFRNL